MDNKVTINRKRKIIFEESNQKKLKDNLQHNKENLQHNKENLEHNQEIKRDNQEIKKHYKEIKNLTIQRDILLANIQKSGNTYNLLEFNIIELRDVKYRLDCLNNI